LYQLIIAAFICVLFALSAKSLRRLKLYEMTTIAILIAIAVGGRAIFAAIPSIQPSSYIIILAGMMFGHGAGLVVGILTPVISNTVLGFGDYIWFQMLAWGLMGFLAGFLPKRFYPVPVVYGALWGYLFGFITNFWWLFASRLPLTPATIIAGNATSFPLDSMHAVCTAALFIVLPYGAVNKIYQKITGTGNHSREMKGKFTNEKSLSTDFSTDSANHDNLGSASQHTK